MIQMSKILKVLFYIQFFIVPVSFSTPPIKLTKFVFYNVDNEDAPANKIMFQRGIKECTYKNQEIASDCKYEGTTLSCVAGLDSKLCVKCQSGMVDIRDPSNSDCQCPEGFIYKVLCPNTIRTKVNGRLVLGGNIKMCVAREGAASDAEAVSQVGGTEERKPPGSTGQAIQDIQRRNRIHRP